MKIVAYIILGAVVGAAAVFGVDYYSNKPELVETKPNDSGLCEGGSCASGETYYGNNVGDTVTDYQLTDFDGETVNLYDIMDGYDKVIIALEADWCSDCHRQDNKMIQDGAIPENVLYIPVFTTYSKEDDAEKTATKDTAQKYVEEQFKDVDYDVYFDVNDTLWEDFDAQGTPTNIVLDANGRIKVISLEVDADTLMLDNAEDVAYTVEGPSNKKQ